MMIITICLMYCLVSLVSIIGFLFITLEIHELIFWCYELLPFCLSIIPICQLFANFLIAWIQFMWHILEIFMCVIFYLLSYILTFLSICLPFINKPFRVSCSFIKWMCSELWQGVFLRGNPILTLFSWVTIMCSFILFFAKIFVRQNNQERGGGNIGRNIEQNANREREVNHDYDDQENENLENRLLEIRQNVLNRNHNSPIRQRQTLRHNRQEAENLEEENIDDILNPDRFEIDRHLCIICIENVRNFAVFPCGHLHFCRLCVEKLFSSRMRVKCPVCNVPIHEYRRIYI